MINSDTIHLIDRTIHEPVRLVVMCMLLDLDKKEVRFLEVCTELQLTKGDLSEHVTILETKGYIKCRRTYENKKPALYLSLTPLGKERTRRYQDVMREICKVGKLEIRRTTRE